jgi:hypothetical protein
MLKIEVLFLSISSLNLLSFSIVLRITHSDKKKTEIAEDLEATSSNVNYFFVAVKTKDHHDAHQHREKGATNRKVNR